MDLEVLAKDKRADCFSGADLNALLREATTAALRRVVFGETGMPVVKERKRGDPMETVWVGVDDFEIAFQKVKPSVTREQRAGYRLLASKFGLQSKK